MTECMRLGELCH